MPSCGRVLKIEQLTEEMEIPMEIQSLGSPFHHLKKLVTFLLDDDKYKPLLK